MPSFLPHHKPDHTPFLHGPPSLTQGTLVRGTRHGNRHNNAHFSCSARSRPNLCCLCLSLGCLFPLQDCFLMSHFFSFSKLVRYANIGMWSGKMNLAGPWIPLGGLTQSSPIRGSHLDPSASVGTTHVWQNTVSATQSTRDCGAIWTPSPPSCATWGEFLELNFIICQPERVSVRMTRNKDHQCGLPRTSRILKVTLVAVQISRALPRKSRFGEIGLEPGEGWLAFFLTFLPSFLLSRFLSRS